MSDLAKVFESGNSQAVRLPKKFRTKESAFIIRKLGSSLLLIPQNKHWITLRESLDMFSDDFFEEGRNQPEIQKREEF